MKRDMDLVRLLLLQVEGDEPPDLSGYTEAQQTYHLALLIEAELVHGAIAHDANGKPAAAHATGLTWKGHDFLAAARNEKLWRKTVDKLKASGLSVTLAILQDMLTTGLKKQLGLE